MPGLTPATLVWQQDAPVSEQFGDIYHSHDGRQEVERVFMAPAHIEERMAGAEDFCIAELGFGTGLNFVVCAMAALRHPVTRLQWISFEKHPLTHADWSRVAATHPDLPLYAELVEQAPPILPGWHRRVLADGRIVLTVFHGDVEAGLPDLAARQRNPVDAWFLDGFAPDRNPDMWHPETLQSMAPLCRAGTTVTTFTAAGRVRRALQAIGFQMRRVDQQPFKRESLAGEFDGPKVSASNRPGRVQVHGAGIGGACMARHLAELGCEVTLHDPQGLASGGSSIDTAVMHTRLLPDGSPAAAFRAGALHYASNYLRRFDGVDITGVLQLQGPNMDQAKLERLRNAYPADGGWHDYWLSVVTETEAREISGASCSGAALWFPQGGIVNLPLLCRSLINHAAIQLVEQPGPNHRDEPVILCTGAAVREGAGLDWLEVTSVHGQLDFFAGEPFPRVPVVGNGYAVPRADGCVLGASYEHRPWDPQRATAHNLELNQHLTGQRKLVWRRRMRAARAISSDRAPIVGRLDDARWAATALGSMGTTAAPLAAAIVASELTGWLAPVDTSVQLLLRPERFRERQARRGMRHVPAE